MSSSSTRWVKNESLCAFANVWTRLLLRSSFGKKINCASAGISSIKSMLLNSQHDGKLIECHHRSLIVHLDIICAISLLRHLRCPAAVSRLVVTVGVFAIQRMGRSWFLTHVSQEVFKFLPSVADLNSSASIPRIFRVLGFFASRPHMKPRVVKSSLGSSMSCFFVSRFINKTSTTTSWPGLQRKVRLENNFRFSAFAVAFPQRPSDWVPSGEFAYGKPSELIPDFNL